MPGIQTEELVGSHQENQGNVWAHFTTDGTQGIDGVGSAGAIDFLRVNGNGETERLECAFQHVDTLLRRRFQQGFLPGISGGDQTQFVCLEQATKVFSKLDMAYMYRIEAAAQKNDASLCQIDSVSAVVATRSAKCGGSGSRLKFRCS